MDGTAKPDRRAFLSAVGLAGLGLSMGAWGPAPQRRLALTIDGLPYAGTSSLADAQRATAGMLRAIRQWRAPVTGFVDETHLTASGEGPARIALLRDWIYEGADLGDQSYEHIGFTNDSVVRYEVGLDRGERVIRSLMAMRGKPLRYVRYPFDTLGPTPAAAQAVAAFLAQRGYRIAPHTVDASDRVFNLPYLEAAKAGDRYRAQRLGLAYVEHVLAAVRYADQAAPQTVGRPIPQVLRLQANALNADWLYMLLGRLTADGWALVSLDQALSDPAYSAPGAILSPVGPSWVWRTLRTRGFARDPELPPDVVQAYQRLGGAPVAEPDGVRGG